MAVAVQNVQASFGRCALDPRFLDSFYRIFMATSAEIAALFRDTDFDKQKKVLRMSLNMLITHAQGTGVVDGYLRQLGEKHSRIGLDIEPRHYDAWLDSLIQAVKQHDPKFTPELERAWRACLAKGIAVLKACY